MADELLFKMACEDEHPEKPFLRKELAYIQDINSANYASNEVLFETGQLASNGMYNDFSDAYIVIPLVITCTGGTGPGAGTVMDWNNALYNASDFLIALKNAHLSIINTFSIDVANVPAIQSSAYINMLLTYRLHSEMSTDDVDLNGPTIGYAKDGTGWRYANAASSTGRGLCNNVNNPNFKQSPASVQYGEVSNAGMYQRQQNFINPVGANANGRNLVYGTTAPLKNCGVNVVENAATYKVWYVDAVLRLKDLLFFNKMPKLSKGTNIRIRMNVNQCSFQVTKAFAGTMDFVTTSMQIPPAGINPLMVAASMAITTCGVVPAAQVNSILVDTALSVEGGAKAIPLGANGGVATTLTCSLNICRNSSLGLSHQLQACRLYVYSYQLHPSYEATYIERPIRKFKFLDVQQFTITNTQPNSNFSQLITQGTKHLQRLVIVPIMNASAHANEGTAFSPLYSPFTTDGCGTCSPYILTNFQVMLGGKQCFASPVNYSYELYLSELQNSGLNANLTTGLVSGRISLYEWLNNYGYIVVDLSRRYNQDEDAALAVMVSGTLTSAKAMDFFCFLEYYKDGELDVTNGAYRNVGASA